ncbi:thioredoxin domain-containing protein [Pandoraea norimbergensis]|uniref:hypothetical protein n=1 Tax=Pandoraea norimbergensis TaxID=93219 RepID=UPI001F22D9A8|nr:hypothetical protein [Pandoraea norimbergensis]
MRSAPSRTSLQKAGGVGFVGWFLAAALGLGQVANAANLSSTTSATTKATPSESVPGGTVLPGVTTPPASGTEPLKAGKTATQHAAVGATLPAATDFAAHARRAMALDAPLIVLVSLRDCVYCGPIRQRELAPLVRSGKYEVREIGMDSAATVRDFDGTTTTGIAWARAHGVKVSPTVLFLDTNGRAIADPLIGAGLPDFYGAYLDDAIANARARLHAASGTTTR